MRQIDLQVLIKEIISDGHFGIAITTSPMPEELPSGPLKAVMGTMLKEHAKRYGGDKTIEYVTKFLSSSTMYQVVTDVEKIKDILEIEDENN